MSLFTRNVQRFCLFLVVVLPLVGLNWTVAKADEARQLVIRGSERTAGVVYKPVSYTHLTLPTKA